MYEKDNRVITMAELEQIICKRFGLEEIDDGGCIVNGSWFSPLTIMESVAREAYGERSY